MALQKAVTDAVTGLTTMIDLTPDEMAEIEAKQQRVSAEIEAQTEKAQAEETAAEAAAQTVSARPTDEDIDSAKTIVDLRDVVRRQNALIDLLLKNAGLKG